MFYSVNITGRKKLRHMTTGTKLVALPVAQYLSKRNPRSLVAVWRHTRKRPDGKSIALFKAGSELVPVRVL